MHNKTSRTWFQLIAKVPCHIQQAPSLEASGYKDCIILESLSSAVQWVYLLEHIVAPLLTCCHLCIPGYFLVCFCLCSSVYSCIAVAVNCHFLPSGVVDGALERTNEIRGIPRTDLAAFWEIVFHLNSPFAKWVWNHTLRRRLWSDSYKEYLNTSPLGHTVWYLCIWMA